MDFVRVMLRYLEQPQATAWVLTVVDGQNETVIGEGVVEGPATERPRQYLLAALDVIDSDARTAGPVELGVTDRGLRTWLLEQGEYFGRIAVLPLTAFAQDRPTAQAKAIRDRLHAALGVDARSRKKAVVCATDGSVGSRSAAAAWVRSDGTWGWKPVRVADVLVAELTAIEDALRHARDFERILILADSQHALRLIENPDIDSPTVAAKEARRQIARHVERIKDVRFRWTKGHSCAGLNDGADRIARLVRRINVDEGVLDMARSIAEESVTAHRAAAA